MRHVCIDRLVVAGLMIIAAAALLGNSIVLVWGRPVPEQSASLVQTIVAGLLGFLSRSAVPQNGGGGDHGH